MDKTTIKSWFARGKKPTASQFAAVFDSYRHQDDPITIASISGLAAALAGKTDNGHNHNITDVNGLTDALAKMVETTYAQLVTMRDGDKLEPGRMYRITDYETTVANDDEARSAGHPFDVIVTATSCNTLSEEARAINSERDDGYFGDCRLNAWKIWYSLDNDSRRFVWADRQNGKGVIYRMIDEWGNDCPYDFKNILFKRYKGYGAWVDYLMYEPYDYNTLYFAFAGLANDWVDYGDQSAWVYTFCQSDYTSLEVVNDMSLLGTVENSGEGSYYNRACNNNVMKPYYTSIRIDGTTYVTQALNNIAIICTDTDNGNAVKCYGNMWGCNCWNMTLLEHAYCNRFGHDCNCVVGAKFHHNRIGDGCEVMLCGNEFEGNTIGEQCGNMVIGNDVCKSTIFDGVRYIHLPGGSAHEKVAYVQVLNGVGGSDSQMLDIEFYTSSKSTQVAGLTHGGELQIWFPADYIQ